MKKMMKLLDRKFRKIIFGFLGAMVFVGSLALSVAAQQADKCYQLGGLKNEEAVTFKVNGKKVTGEYTVKRDYDDANIERYAFTGRAAGNSVTVKFSGKKPDSLPAKPASYTWTIGSSPTRKYLRVQLYGKNYETNKYSSYFSNFYACPDGKMVQ